MNTDKKTQIPALKIVGCHRAEMGVGRGLRAAARALLAVRMPVSLFSRETDSHVYDDLNFSMDYLINKKLDHDINLMHINADETVHLDQLLPAALLKNKYNIGYWAWELSRFPACWHVAFGAVDEIWVPSEFVGSSISSCTTKPVHVIPHPVTLSCEAIPNRALFNLQSDVFYFIVTMDLNSFIDRKNPYAAIQAFQAAFRQNENVGLIIKLHGKSEFMKARETLCSVVEGDLRVVIIDKNISCRENDVLQASVDCYVSLHRSEGFGLNLAEYMLKGKPVIATAYSGNMDFMSRDEALLVDYDLVPVGENQYPCWEDQVWASPDIKQAAQHMKKIFEDKDFRAQIGQRAQQRIQTQLSLEVVGKKMQQRLLEISERRYS